VLVVEDEQDIAGLIKHASNGKRRWTSKIAGSGDTALKSVTEDLPDLVILDLNLPVLSGIEVCRILRGGPETAKLPVIMLTARSTEAIASPGWTSAPTTTSPSRSAFASSRRACARCCGDVPTGSRRRHAGLSRQAHRRRLRRRRRARGRRAGSPHAARVRAASLPRREQEPRAVEKIGCSSACGIRPAIETRSVDVHVGRLRGKLRTAGQQIETVVGLG